MGNAADMAVVRPTAAAQNPEPRQLFDDPAVEMPELFRVAIVQGLGGVELRVAEPGGVGADDLDLDHFADMVSALLEGDLVISRAMDEPRVTAQRVLMPRSYIKPLFRPK